VTVDDLDELGKTLKANHQANVIRAAAINNN
jgi:hypothetical protein